METKIKKCCLCGKEFKGYGNNAEPVMIGCCCNECNTSIVIPTRIANLKAVPAPKVGDKVHIIYMKGEQDYNGREGVVQHIDDIGQLHGTWGGCALIPNVDTYYIIK